MAHSTDNYRSGNGVIYMAPWSGVTPPLVGALVDVGNGTAFSVEPKITKKPHYAHRDGYATKDKEIPVKREGTLKITLDEFNTANLRLFFQGTLNGTTIKPLESDNEEYLVRFVEVLISGTERIHEWSRVSLSAAAVLEMITDGEGEGDWSKLEFTGELLSNDTPISFDSRTHGKFGLIYVAPTT